MEDGCSSALSPCDSLFVLDFTAKANQSNWYGAILFRLYACIRACVRGWFASHRRTHTHVHTHTRWQDPFAPLRILKTLTSRAIAPLWRHGGVLSEEIETEIKMTCCPYEGRSLFMFGGGDKFRLDVFFEMHTRDGEKEK